MAIHLLSTSTAVRRKVSAMFTKATRDHRRVVLVAFIGANPTRYLPDPKGVEVYCWPQPGGTNPEGLRELIREKALVKFVDRLHMKVYWVQDHGAVITSANLSDNAMEGGNNGLREAGVFIRPFPEKEIAKLMAGLRPRVASDSEIRSLQRKHDRGGFPSGRRSPPNYGEWFERKESSSPWKYCCWQNAKKGISNAAKSEAKAIDPEVHLGKVDVISLREKNFFRKYDWVLFIGPTPKRKGSKRETEWFFVDGIVKVPSRDPGYESGYPWQAFQLPVKRSRSIPFNCSEKRFQRALQLTLKGTDLEKKVVPPTWFLKALHRRYVR